MTTTTEPTYRPNANGNFPGEIIDPTNEQMDAYLSGSDEVTCCSGCNRFFDSIDTKDEHHAWCEWEAAEAYTAQGYEMSDAVHGFEQQAEDAWLKASENSYLAQDAERWLNG